MKSKSLEQNPFDLYQPTTNTKQCMFMFTLQVLANFETFLLIQGPSVYVLMLQLVANFDSFL